MTEPAGRAGRGSGGERLLLVLDQGSSATKGALIAADPAADPTASRLRILARAEAPVAVRAEGVRVEHDPEAILAGVREVIARLAGAAPPGRASHAGSGVPVIGRGVAAIGLACQRSTCLLWERETGRPLTPALSWRDRRELETVAALARQGHGGGSAVGDEVARRTGLRLSPHYAAAKLARLLEQVPSGRRRAEAGEILAGTLDAFLLHRLAGRPSTEPGLAGRTLLWNLETGDWDPWLGDLFGVPAAALPELLPSAGGRGEFEGVPVTAAAGDQQAALLGHGGWQAGTAAVHFGTGAFVLAGTGEEVHRHPGLLTAVLASLPSGRRFQLEGSVNSAGAAVAWAAGITGEDLEAWSDRALDPDALPLVLPAFAGAAAPWWRPEAGGVLAGLTLASDGAALLGGVLAGVAQRVADSTEAMAEAGVAIRMLRASGRLTRLRGLVQLLAELTGLPVEVPAGTGDEEAGLAGVARLALAGLRAGQKGADQPLLAPPPEGKRVEPSWPEGRRQRVRAGWRAFVERALALGSP